MKIGVTLFESCQEVVYALDGLEDKIFVAQYKAKLPSEQKIKKILQKL